MKGKYSTLLVGVLCSISLEVSSRDEINTLIPFRDVEITNTVSLEIEKAFQNTNYLKPSFKFAEYRVQELSEQNQRDIVFINTLPNGLLNIKQHFSSGFIYEMESLAGLLFLKSRFVGFGKGSISINSSISLVLPSALEIGKSIKISQKQTTFPLSTIAEEYGVNTHCLVTKKYPANEIDESLLGIATELICDSESPNKHILAFLENYGFALTLSMENTYSAPTIYKYSDFKFSY